MSDQIYRELILELYRHPLNYGTIENADARAKDSNPLCGDEVEIYLKLDPEGKIVEAKHSSHGCAISQASTSLLTEMIKNKNIKEVAAFDKSSILKALGDPELGPVRIKCALLPLKVLKLAAYSHIGQQLDMSDESTPQADSGGVKVP